MNTGATISFCTGFPNRSWVRRKVAEDRIRSCFGLAEHLIQSSEFHLALCYPEQHLLYSSATFRIHHVHISPLLPAHLTSTSILPRIRSPCLQNPNKWQSLNMSFDIEAKRMALAAYFNLTNYAFRILKMIQMFSIY